MLESGANLITILGGRTQDLVIKLLGPMSSLNATATLHPLVTLADTGETIERTAPDDLLVARMMGGCAACVEVAGSRPPDAPSTFEIGGTTDGC
jgi:hypothetical protein